MTQSRLIWILAALSAVILYFLNSISAIFFPFFTGLIGAYALNGTVTRLEKFKISRGIASSFIIFGVILLLVILVIVFIPFIHQQLLTLASNVPGIVESTFTTMSPVLERASAELGTPSAIELKAQIKSHLGDIMSWSIKILTNVLTNSMALANLLSLVILTPIIMFYLLKDWPKLVSSVTDIIPHPYRQTIKAYALRIDDTLSAYARGQLLVCLILMVLYAISLTIIDLPHGLFVGIMTGFMSFIPYVGMITGLIASLAIAFANALGFNHIMAIFIAFTIIGLIEGNILSPRLIGERIGLHPVWIIFSLLAGATWFGFFGVLLALPTAAIVGVIVRIALDAYQSSYFYKGKSSEASPAA